MLSWSAQGIVREVPTVAQPAGREQWFLLLSLQLLLFLVTLRVPLSEVSGSQLRVLLPIPVGHHKSQLVQLSKLLRRRTAPSLRSAPGGLIKPRFRPLLGAVSERLKRQQALQKGGRTPQSGFRKSPPRCQTQQRRGANNDVSLSELLVSMSSAVQPEVSVALSELRPSA